MIKLDLGRMWVREGSKDQLVELSGVSHYLCYNNNYCFSDASYFIGTELSPFIFGLT